MKILVHDLDHKYSQGFSEADRERLGQADAVNLAMRAILSPAGAQLAQELAASGVEVYLHEAFTAEWDERPPPREPYAAARHELLADYNRPMCMDGSRPVSWPGKTFLDHSNLGLSEHLAQIAGFYLNTLELGNAVKGVVLDYFMDYEYGYWLNPAWNSCEKVFFPMFGDWYRESPESKLMMRAFQLATPREWRRYGFQKVIGNGEVVFQDRQLTKQLNGRFSEHMQDMWRVSPLEQYEFALQNRLECDVFQAKNAAQADTAYWLAAALDCYYAPPRYEVLSGLWRRALQTGKAIPGKDWTKDYSNHRVYLNHFEKGYVWLIFDLETGQLKYRGWSEYPPQPEPEPEPEDDMAVYWVKTTGDDDTGDGSSGTPWATITHAAESVPDGSTIRVSDGTYTGKQYVTGTWSTGLTIEAENAYGAKLRNAGSSVMVVESADGVTISGFDMAHTGSGGSGLVMQVTIWEPVGSKVCQNITIENCIIHDSYNNDLLKINNPPNAVGRMNNIVVDSCMFFNQEGSDEHIDLNGVENCVIQNCVFFNDYASSGRAIDNNAANFIVVKASANSGGAAQCDCNTIKNNVFANFEGNQNNGFIRLGEDAGGWVECSNITIVDNLFLHTGNDQAGYTFGMFGTQDCKFVHNSSYGPMDYSKCVAGLIGNASFPSNTGVEVSYNIFSRENVGDKTLYEGAADTDGEHTFFGNNNYPGAGTWSDDVIDWTYTETQESTDNPNWGDASLATLTLPYWNGSTFADGSSTIAQALSSLCSAFNDHTLGTQVGSRKVS